MSLLREIQNDAVNSNVKVSDLLRKCKILAYRLGNTDFKNWVEYELNGYPKDLDELPEYRILNNVNSKGHFSGAFGSGLRNADVPTYNLPKDLQENLSKANFYSPIATLENLASSQSSILTQDWKPIVIAHYGDGMYENYVCMQAWKIIPTSFVIGIVDTIKTKILNFVLEIEMINKDAGDVESNSNPIPQEKVSQIFNINISGNVGNLASGNSNSNIQQSTNTEIPEEFLELIAKIQDVKEEDDEILQELENKIEELGRNVGSKNYKEKYLELMGFLSDHTTVVSGLVMPFLPYLSSFLVT
ncbi:AbiTii domain-containing protein [Acinetobacter bohemicus]|uniref:AbiTii domain-containing protein n=1 Tax=Acinetobacter bohemicus TaxID=1435036 RepID=UPI004042262A